jgi:hypothetical protein
VFAEAKIAAFEALRPDIEGLPPAHRRRLASLCRHWAELAEPRALVTALVTEASPTTEVVPMAGVLLELSRGFRSEE